MSTGGVGSISESHKMNSHNISRLEFIRIVIEEIDCFTTAISTARSFVTVIVDSSRVLYGAIEICISSLEPLSAFQTIHLCVSPLCYCYYVVGNTTPVDVFLTGAFYVISGANCLG